MSIEYTTHKVTVELHDYIAPDELVESLFDAVDAFLTDYFDGAEDTPDWDFMAVVQTETLEET